MDETPTAPVGWLAMEDRQTRQTSAQAVQRASDEDESAQRFTVMSQPGDPKCVGLLSLLPEVRCLAT